MRHFCLLLSLVLLAGCTTAPQADVMDFVFPSRNACQASAKVPVQPTQPLVQAQPVAQAQPVIQAQPAIQAQPVPAMVTAEPTMQPITVMAASCEPCIEVPVEQPRRSICDWSIFRPLRRLCGRD